ncbi:MAG: hypothetical protein LJE68_17445 [Rhodobacter sp.]|nr:hypothetical protein [Rhodobacter sp.]
MSDYRMQRNRIILAHMFRQSLAALILFAAPVSAQDSLDISATLARSGLAATETALAADQGDANARFALGSVRFLRAVEKTLQLRYRHNATLDDLGIPVLRLPVPPNPDAQPFYPALIADLFAGLIADMDAARAALDSVEGDVALTIDLAALWFDINGNASRDAGEGVFEVAGSALARRPGEAGMNSMPDLLNVRFDTADVAWLRAYTHLLSGIGELVIAFDPTDVIAEVGTSVTSMAALRGTETMDRFSYLRQQEQMVDMFAMIYGALNRVPDASHTVAARDHLLAMIAENRAFWQAVGLETDNAAEWIPNARQSSALGFELPPDTSAVWLDVLSDAEAVLTGKLLVGHWRIEPGGGINVAKLLENPVAIDIVTWIHGHGLLPYMESGPLIGTANLRRFEAMFGGDALLFMVWLN